MSEVAAVVIMSSVEELSVKARTAFDVLPTCDLRVPKPFWMVWRGGSWKSKFRHKTADGAVLEAARLAEEFPDKEFYVIQQVASIRKRRA